LVCSLRIWVLRVNLVAFNKLLSLSILLQFLWPVPKHGDEFVMMDLINYLYTIV
jgi:hypothetical protein